MALPAQKPTRPWRGLLAWSLIVFAAGIAAGPWLVDYASQGVEAGATVLAKRWPRLLGRYQPAASEVMPEPARRAVPPSPPSAPKAAAAAPVIQPRAAAPGAPVVGVVPQRVAVSALPPTPAEPEHAERPARGGHAKAAAKVSAPPPPPAPTRKSAKGGDPFDTGGAAPAAPKREPKAAAEPAPEPAPRPAASKSSDPLDSLLAGAVTDSKGKGGTKKTSKEIDAMLKDVQKSEPSPAAKPKAAAELPPLSPSDISKAMAGVKARSNECARRLGQKGIAELNLNVGKNGKVADVSVGGKVAGTPLADCIAKAARGANFPPNAGLRFDYKIDAR